MLAMHYAIPLSGHDALAGIRTRVKERGHLFDGMAGLSDKLFLLDIDDPCYATFYLWREPDAALAFLNGPLFDAVVQSFGRPEVRLFLTRATGLPAGEWRNAVLGPTAPTSRSEGIESLDPRTGAALWLSRPPTMGRRFGVMYRAHG